MAKAHRNADIHLHDPVHADGLLRGLVAQAAHPGGASAACPARSRRSRPATMSNLCNRMVNFLGIMQETNGRSLQRSAASTQYLAPFVKADNLTSRRDGKQVRRVVRVQREHAFALGRRQPFSNITLDWVCPADLRDQPAIVGGKEMDFTYGDCKVEMDMVNKAFIEIMIEGDANGRGFQYPIPRTPSRGLRLERNREQPAAVRNDLEVRHSRTSPTINTDMEPSAFRLLPLAPRPARAAQRSRRFLRQRRVHESIGVVTIQHAAPGYLSRRRSRLLPSTRPSRGRFRALAAHEARSGPACWMGLYPYTKRYLGVREPLLHDRPGGHER